jgi:hypothetical protein
VLRRQVLILSRKSPSRVRLRNLDRLLLVSFYGTLPSILSAIIVVKPEPCSAGIDAASEPIGN